MIKNNTFNVYDRMDKKALETMAAAFESDFAAARDPNQREFIRARVGIVYALLKYKMHEDWLPTPENINALPEPVRKFIHDIETNVDPQGLVRENVLIKDTCKMLVIKLEEKGKVDQAFVDELVNGPIYVLRKVRYEFFEKKLKEAGIKVVK